MQRNDNASLCSPLLLILTLLATSEYLSQNLQEIQTIVLNLGTEVCFNILGLEGCLKIQDTRRYTGEKIESIDDNGSDSRKF